VLRVDEARRRALRPWAIVGAGAVVVAVAAVGLVASPVFDADTITVSGERHLSETQVLRIARIDHDTNVFRVDEGTVERRLQRSPWVLDARVTADLPSTIRIEVMERSPVAVASTPAGVSLVSADGVVLGPAPVGVAFPEIRASEIPAAGDPTAAGAATDPVVDESAAGAVPLSDEAIEEGAKAAGALSRALPGEVATIDVAPDGTLTLDLEGGVGVAFGRAIELEAKAEALTAILSYAKGEPTPLVSIDVSTPAAPTARFVGTTVTAPVAEGEPHSNDSGKASDGGPSSSPSATP
jgi:cell division protein FtsQ